MANLSTATLPKTRTGIETYIVPDGSCFLFDSATEAGFALDQLGALVWDYCDGATPVEQIVGEIEELVPDQPEIGARVRQWLVDFGNEGLLETPVNLPARDAEHG